MRLPHQHLRLTELRGIRTHVLCGCLEPSLTQYPLEPVSLTLVICPGFLGVLNVFARTGHLCQSQFLTKL